MQFGRDCAILITIRNPIVSQGLQKAELASAPGSEDGS
jgi:hypothetical protein